MSAKKKSSSHRPKTAAVKRQTLKLLDPLEAGTVTFACDLYADYSSSFIGSAEVVRAESKESKRRVS